MLAGRYLLGPRLGRGGMGTVWRATDQMLDREVAVKELSVGHLAEEDLQIVQSRMKQEARAAARIKHPGVITIHDVVEQDGKPWIVMELIDGRSLSELVEQEGVIDPREAARIGAQVLAALERAHLAGVIHRDVKPANVLLERGTGRVVLTDFGIATFVGDSALTRTGDLVGSPDYLAPERVHGGRPGPESDLWALGATLYAAVEGQSPFRRESPLTTLAAVVTDPLPEPRNAGPLAPVLQALMAKEPQQRPPATDVRRMLENIAAGHTTNITLESLGASPLRTPTQAVPAVDRLGAAGRETDAGFPGYTPTTLGTAVNGASGGTAGGTAGGGATGGGTAVGGGALGGGATAPTARVPAQNAPHVPASASGAPRLLGGPLFADEAGYTGTQDNGYGRTAHDNAGQGTYAGQGSYAGQATHGGQDSYGGQGTYGGQDSYGGQGTYGGQGDGLAQGPASARPRRGRRWAWLLVAALIAGGAGAGGTYWYNHRHKSASPSATDKPTSGASATPSDQPVQVPPGYQLTHDPYGFSFGLPVSTDQPWVRTAPKGPLAITYSPGNDLYEIIFGYTYANSRSAVEQAKWLMSQLQANDKSYKLLHYNTNNFKNSVGAQIEFLFTTKATGQKMHGIEQFYKAPNGNEYDTFVAYPVDDWTTGYQRFEEILQTFTVP
ncbi:Serine/threonine protein kinase [Streptacidiphilus jiangxiensis]|uniref:non-specific serine/threonine protein kinase n=1 Tax=Streptacidiphilus jiangxiensis TaxID=235985 RepID=A0A1H7MAI0_STRJI|nr:Serine/threonine protein kinase [Streptacidiphilus jiangxiensis]